MTGLANSTFSTCRETRFIAVRPDYSTSARNSAATGRGGHFLQPSPPRLVLERSAIEIVGFLATPFDTMTCVLPNGVLTARASLQFVSIPIG